MSDGIWAMVTEQEMRLSRVCKEEPMQTIRVNPRLSIVELHLECAAFGMTIFLPLYYQAEERYKEKQLLMDLLGGNKSEWVEL